MFGYIKSKLTGQGKQEPIRELSEFLEVGFHGDKYLLEIADTLAKKSEVFVETGSNVGSTLAYMAKNYPSLRCFSCEPDDAAYTAAVGHTTHYGNVALMKGMSQEFIKHLAQNESWMFSKRSMFWLDAHGYGFEWPLKVELDFITRNFKSGYILIDDFLVPGQDQFGYDVYLDQICSYDFVKESLNEEIAYQLYYPNYQEKTSKHHPLRGWGLIVFGSNDFEIPVSLQDKVVRKI